MNEEELARQLDELVTQAEGGTGLAKLSALARRAGQQRRRLQKSISVLEESLDYLRVCIKYMVFDLEATRRENRDLRKLSEENGE
jgi:hypothetical protein